MDECYGIAARIPSGKGRGLGMAAYFATLSAMSRGSDKTAVSAFGNRFWCTALHRASLVARHAESHC